MINTENESHLQTWPLGAGIICGIVLFGSNDFPAVWNKCISTRRCKDQEASGFITATYVVMVSVVSVFMGRKCTG